MKKSISFVSTISLYSLLFLTSFAHAEGKFDITGETLLAQAESRSSPLGFQAATIFKTIEQQSFESNVSFSNAWIKAQLKRYDSAPDFYKKALAPMVEGGGEHGIGMRNWLTDKENVAWWDKTVMKAVGEDGYARVVALNSGFAPGSKDYLLTYGFERKFDNKSGVMSLNGATLDNTSKDKPLFSLKGDMNPKDQFVELVKFGDPVRKQMFAFYDAFNDGNVSRGQVEAFNAAYVKSGGCAMAATDVVERDRMARYLNALNYMGKTLADLGFKVR